VASLEVFKQLGDFELKAFGNQEQRGEAGIFLPVFDIGQVAFADAHLVSELLERDSSLDPFGTDLPA